MNAPQWMIGLVALGTLIGARPALAKGVLGADVNVSTRVGDGSDPLSTGWGFNVRAGLGLPIPLLTIELGAMFRYNHWSIDRQGLQGSQSSQDLLAGGRIGAGAFIHPWVEFYLGYGHIGSDFGPQGGATVSDGHSGTGYLVGGGVDLVLSLLAIGIHLDYNKDSVDGPAGLPGSAQWMALGANVTVSF